MRWISTSSLVIVAGLSTLVLAGSRARGSELEGGGWRGTWVDNNAGHEGALRARFRPTRDGNYRAVFTGTFYKVIPFVFAAKLNVVERDAGRVTLAGESRLMGFGRFTYNAVADEHHFNSQYQSGRWAGEFNLSR